MKMKGSRWLGASPESTVAISALALSKAGTAITVLREQQGRGGLGWQTVTPHGQTAVSHPRRHPNSIGSWGEAAADGAQPWCQPLLQDRLGRVVPLQPGHLPRSYLVKDPRQNVCLRPPEEAQLSPTQLCQTGRIILRPRVSPISPHSGQNWMAVRTVLFMGVKTVISSGGRKVGLGNSHICILAEVSFSNFKLPQAQCWSHRISRYSHAELTWINNLDKETGPLLRRNGGIGSLQLLLAAWNGFFPAHQICPYMSPKH